MPLTSETEELLDTQRNTTYETWLLGKPVSWLDLQWRARSSWQALVNEQRRKDWLVRHRYTRAGDAKKL